MVVAFDVGFIAGGAVLGGDDFMQDAHPFTRTIVFHQQTAWVTRGAHHIGEVEIVNGGGELFGQGKRAFKAVVGIKEKHVIGFALCALQSQFAVVAEVFPLVLQQFARNAALLKKGLNDALSAIVGTCVGNDPIIDVDVGLNIGQGVHNDAGFIFDNHVEANGTHKRP